MQYKKRTIKNSKPKITKIKSFKNSNNSFKNSNNSFKNSNKLFNFKTGGGQNAAASAPDIDLQSLTQQDIESLMSQGIMPEQLLELAQQSGQPVSPILMEMIQASQGKGQPPEQSGMDAMGIPPPGAFNRSKDAPAMMDLATYAQYRKLEKDEIKKEPKTRDPNVYGYLFSNLVNEDILRDIKRTQGGFLIGVNLNNLFNVFRDMVISEEKKQKKERIQNSNTIFKRVGEYVNVDFDKILEKKMGFRGSDVPLLPEKILNDYSSFYEILEESKKYADMGFNGEITPLGLLVMTRMLYKYKEDNAQWLRVATILELIYKYLGNGNESRQEFFKNTDNLPVLALMDLEEFYNTDHIFMSSDELEEFKKTLTFYKYNSNVNIQKKIKEIKNKEQPIM